MRAALLLALLAPSAATATPHGTSESIDPADPHTPDEPTVDTEPEDPDAPRIVGGLPTPAFPAVVGLAVQHQGGLSTFCSGTLITDTWVVTAAHCVDALHDYERGGWPIVVWFGSHAPTGAVDHVTDVVAAVNHPGWTGSLDDGADIAVVEIGDAPAGVSPMPIVTCDCDLRGGEILDYVGFGITADGASDAGIKRIAAIDFDRIDGDFLIGRHPSRNLCSGDSGGAALRTVEGEHRLAGVNSFVFDTAGDGTSCVTGGSGATRIAPFVDWIASETDWLQTGLGGGEHGTDPEQTDPEEGGTSEGGTSEEPPVEEGSPPASSEGGAETPSEEGGSAPPELPFGCACASAATPPAGLAGLGLLFVVGLVRRQR